MQREEVLIQDNLRIVLFRSVLQDEALLLVFDKVSKEYPPEASSVLISPFSLGSFEDAMRPIIVSLEGSGVSTTEIEISKYVTKTYTQGGVFLFLGKAKVRIETTPVKEIQVSFGDLLSVRGGNPSVMVTSEDKKIFVLRFVETDTLRKYREMPLKDLEELAYAVQIPYSPPLTEEQRDAVLEGVRWILQHPNLTEEDREEMTKSTRSKSCDNPNTPIGYDNVLLKSDAQLAFMPDRTPSGEVYYCLDKTVDLPETLRQDKNLSNMKPLTLEQKEFLAQVESNNLYPRIATGDYFDEVASRLQGQVEPEIPLYRRRAEELAALVAGVGLVYSANAVISFANNLNVEQYDEYLRHRSIRQKVEATERDAASAEALGILLRYYTQKNQISTEQGGYALREIGKTVEEYAAMIQNNWDYKTLIQEMGVEGEVYWKPNREYSDEEKELTREGELSPSGLRVGEWTLKYPNGQLYAKVTYNDRGNEVGHWVAWHDNGTKLKEGDYLNGQKTGRWISWRSNETKRSEGDYLNGQETGRWTAWWRNGTKQSEGNYINGHETGRWIYWCDDENKESEGNYLNGQQTGRWTYWHDNETKYSEGDYLNGQETGRWTAWYDDGNKEEEGDYLNGQKTGLWTFWHHNRNKKEEGDYLNGQKTGRWTEWHDNRARESEGDFLNGKKTGRWIFWHSNGNKESEGDYFNSQKTGRWIEWQDNGKKKSEGDYLNGKKQVVGLIGTIT